jgi:hypothetical protein
MFDGLSAGTLYEDQRLGIATGPGTHAFEVFHRITPVASQIPSLEAGTMRHARIRRQLWRLTLELTMTTAETPGTLDAPLVETQPDVDEMLASRNFVNGSRDVLRTVFDADARTATGLCAKAARVSGMPCSLHVSRRNGSVWLFADAHSVKESVTLAVTAVAHAVPSQRAVPSTGLKIGWIGRLPSVERTAGLDR